MVGFQYQPDVLYLRAGTDVTLVLINEDEVVHDLWIGRAAFEESGVLRHREPFFADGDVRVVPASARYERDGTVGARIAPGRTVEMRFRVGPEHVGEWSVDCFTGAGCHGRAGLAATLIVEPAR